MPPPSSPAPAPASASRPRRPLFERFPDLAASVPWLPLAELPTPVARATAIEDWLGAPVFVKRDDLASPIYGGNKVRRYEFLLADAKARGAKRIVTVGGLASTQAMATAIFGRRLGFDVTVVLFDQPVTRFAKDTIRGLVAEGAELVFGDGYLGTALRTARAWRAATDPYFILPGAMNALANIGYVDAMLELAEQVAREELPRPDWIVLPTGSSGTLAALALGAAHLGWETTIVGVRITTALACNRLTVNAILRHTDAFLAARDRRWRRVASRARYRLYGGALGAGYGHPTLEAIDGAAQSERLTGAAGEITYSGKALAGLRALLAAERASGRAAPKHVLLWNTLSTPRPVFDPTIVDPRVPSALRWVLDAKPVA